MWAVVPCARRKSLQTDSWKDVEKILKGKLATIDEEPESCEESQASPRLKRFAKKGKKKKKEICDKVGSFLLSHFSVKDSYVLFMTRFASKGSFGGLLEY